MNKFIECIIEQLSKTKLFEMALDRAKYIDLIINLSDQIAENWCLIRYCTTYDSNNINKDHWKSELYAACSRLLRQNVSTDKRKATEYGFIGNLEFNNTDTVYYAVEPKFKKEGFSLTHDICDDFVGYGLQKLMFLISSKRSSGKFNELYRYIDEDI